MVMGLPLSSPVACFVSECCKPAHHRATSTGSFAADFWLLLELLAKDLQQFFNNPFPIIGIRRFSNTNLRIIGELLLQSSNNFSLYLRGDGVKYWDVPIVIRKRKIYAGVYLFSNSRRLLGIRNCWRCSSTLMFNEDHVLVILYQLVG